MENSQCEMGNVKLECEMGRWNENVKWELCEMGFSQKNETILNVLNHDNENKNKLININNNFTSFPLKIKENENIIQELDLNEQKKENTNIYYNNINNNQYNGQIFEYYNINQNYTDINCTKGTNHFFDNINFI